MAVTQGSVVLLWNTSGITLATAGRSGLGQCIPAIVNNIYPDASTIDCIAFLPVTSQHHRIFAVTPTSTTALATSIGYTLL